MAVDPFARGAGFFSAVRVRPCEQSVLSCSGSALSLDLEKSKTYNVDAVFDPSSSNDDVYAALLPLVRKAESGGTVAIVAYGPTGTGKTHTVTALATRAAHDLLDEGETTAEVTCVELLGDNCRDLLTGQAVRIGDPGGELVLKGATSQAASSPIELLAVIESALQDRATAPTQRHEESSRSHAVIRISLNTGGKLTLADLAGSERAADRGDDKVRLQESIAINKALSALGACFRANTGGASVPFRQNRLTLLLRDAFAYSDAVSVFLACIHPRPEDAQTTKATLNYTEAVNMQEKRRTEAMTLARPQDWDAARAADFLRELKIDPAAFRAFTGPQLLALSAEEASRRSQRGDLLHQRLRELEAKGAVATTAAAQKRFQKNIESSQDLVAAVTAVKETLRVQGRKNQGQAKRHSQALEDIKVALLESVEQVHQTLILLAPLAGEEAPANKMELLAQWKVPQCERKKKLTQLPAEDEPEAFLAAGEQRVKELLAEGKTREKEFVEDRAALEAMGKGIAEEFQEDRDRLLEKLSQQDVSALPPTARELVDAYEENKQSWDDFWKAARARQ